MSDDARHLFRDQLAKLYGWEFASIVKPDRLGSLNFSFMEPSLISVAGLAKSLHEATGREGLRCPDAIYDVPREAVSAILSELDNARRLQVGAPVASTRRDEIIRDLNAAIVRFMREAWTLMFFVERAAPARAREEVELLVSDASAKITGENGVLTQAKKALGEVQALVDDVRKASSLTAASAEAGHFKTLADTHERWAKWWLGATCGLGVILVALVVGLPASQWPLATNNKAPITTLDLIRFIAMRVGLIAVVLLGVTQATRNYRAHRHNEVVNRHRENALETFRAFVNAGAQPHIRDAVLMQASTAVFTAHPTGYLGAEGDVISQATIIDAIKLATSPPPPARPPGS